MSITPGSFVYSRKQNFSSSFAGTTKKFIQRVQIINASTKSPVERLCDLTIYALSVLGYIGSISAPDEASLKAEAHALQCTTAGPYNAIPTNSLRVGSTCGIAPTLWRFTLLASRPVIELRPVQTRSIKAWKRSRQLVGMIWLQLLLSAPTGKRIFWLLPWLVALRMRSLLYVAWTAVANLMILRRTRNKRLPQPCSATNCMSKTLPDQSLHVPPEFLDRSVVFSRV